MAVAELKLPWDTSFVALTREPEASVLAGLRALAYADAEVSARAESLFMFLRKISGQKLAAEYLMGIQYLAVQGDPAGARLLAAFVDVSTPGDRLLPRVRRFTSSRRLYIRIQQAKGDPGQMHQDWLARLEDLSKKCRQEVPEGESYSEPDALVPGDEEPWPWLRDCLELLVARLSWGDDFGAADRYLLVELLRLEVDAWQERISHLAGSIDPFRVPAITKILPLLSLADAEIRDLRQMITWIEEGCQAQEFQKPLSRSLDILEENDRASLRMVLAADPGLAPLADLFAGLAANPVRVPVMAHCIKVLMALADRLALLGVPAVELDLVTAALLVQAHFPDDGGAEEFHLPLPAGFPRACEHILDLAEQGMGAEASELAGLQVVGDQLVVAIPEGGMFLENGFPAAIPAREEESLADEVLAWAEAMQAPPATPDPEQEGVDPNDATVSELKHLVMTNIQSISVLLGFLRNPKIVAIPGLVEEVVNRTRNPKVIETIATVRVLHTGFANRGVPLACLRSPVNVPVGVLRKFMHVKFVSKMDLKRLVLDKAGIRKEVGRAVKKYLETLA
jgi:hypothetical protein